MNKLKIIQGLSK